MFAQALVTYIAGVVRFFLSSVQLGMNAHYHSEISRYSDWEVVIWVFGGVSLLLIQLFAVICPLLPGFLAIFGFP